MTSGPTVKSWAGASRRRVPRFPMQEVLDVTVLRKGVPDIIPGRSVNLCERGIAVVLAEELIPGEAVGVEVQLSPLRPPLRARAIVRYQDKLRSGLEFVVLTPEQRESIRSWALNARPGAHQSGYEGSIARNRVAGGRESGATKATRRKRYRMAWAALIVVIAFAAGVFWWRWNRSWQDLESSLNMPQTAATVKPEERVPAEVMEKLLVHRVEPVYPVEARKERLQGIIALDIVVGPDGSVASMHALNGPDVLARAAMDALRWWKFQPYRINGQPAAVSTTVAVEFKQ